MTTPVDLMPGTVPTRRLVADESQHRVMAHRSGPLLVLGAAGTGKTTTMLETVAAQIADGADATRVVVLTPSRRAANALRDKVVGRLAELGGALPPQFMTVYALCLGIVNSYSQQAPLRVLTAPEQEARLREVLANSSHPWPKRLAAAVPTRAFARELREVLSRARQVGMEPDDLVESGDPLWRAVGGFFEEYLQVLDAQGLIDYGEVVYRARLLANQPGVAAELAGRFNWWHVDEFEEIEPSHLALIGDLSAPDHHVVAYADPDQTAFGFRGSGPRVVREFIDQFSVSDEAVVTLDRQWRLPAIAAAANRRLTSRLPAPLTDRDVVERYRNPMPVEAAAASDAVSVDVAICATAGTQSDHIARVLRHAHVADGVDWSDMAVIVRNGRRSLPALARALSAAEIPVEIASEEIVLGRQLAVRPLLLGLQAIAQTITELGARELLSSPLGGLDAAQMQSVEAAGPLSELLRGEAVGATTPLPLVELLAEGRKLAADDASVAELLWHLWQGTDWPDRLRAQALRGGDPLRRADRDLDAIVALFDVARRFGEQSRGGQVASFFAEVEAQQIPADTGRVATLRPNAARLLTAHRAKGLQWRVVVLADVTEGVWPNARTRALMLDPDRLRRDEISEQSAGRAELLASERRLFHLACSRASERLVVTATAGTAGEGDAPSRFLGELGVGVHEVASSQVRPGTMAALVARLRRRAVDSTLSPALRQAASSELARLREAGVASADPTNWWGLAGITWADVPVALPGRPVALSPSAVESLLVCPRRWFLTRRAGGESGKSPAAAFGTVIHRLIERSALDNVPATELTGYLERIWDQLGYAAAWESAAMKVEATDALERYALWRASTDREIVASEAQFSTTVDVAGSPVRLRGVIDRLERSEAGWHIVDFKTSKRAPTRAEVVRHSQLGLYQLAVRQGGLATLTGNDPQIASAELIYLRVPAGARDPSATVRVQPPLDPGESWIHEQLAQACQTVRAERFDATAGPHCQVCPFTADCPALREVAGL